MFILSVDSLSAPIAAPLNATQFTQLYAIILNDIPDFENASYEEVLATSAVTFTYQFGLGWTLRTHQDLFSPYHDGG
jgi:hypothetical protein